jgi:hypothetical protein
MLEKFISQSFSLKLSIPSFASVNTEKQLQNEWLHSKIIPLKFLRRTPKTTQIATFSPCDVKCHMNNLWKK